MSQVLRSYIINKEHHKFRKDFKFPIEGQTRFHCDNIADIEYISVCNDNISLSKLYQDGVFRGISVMLRPHETLMFKLKYKSE